MAGQDHLKQTPLPSTAIQAIHEFVEWLNTTEDWARLHDGLYACIDPELEDHLKLLRDKLNIQQNTSTKVFRTKGQKPSKVYCSSGTACIYPLQGPAPKISGQSVAVGCSITIEETVTIYPPLDLLVRSAGSLGEGDSESQT